MPRDAVSDLGWRRADSCPRRLAPAFWVLADHQGNEIRVTTWQGGAAETR
jgi:hypothetical protein